MSQMAKKSVLTKKVIIYLCCEIVVTVAAILGNALVAMSFIRDRRMRTPTNTYVFSLAAVNLLTSIVAIPVYLHSMITQRPRDFTACLYVNTLLMTFCTISIFHLVAVSFDRYLAVVWGKKPLSHSRGMRRAIIFLIVAWLGGSAIGTMPLMGWHGGKPGVYDLSRCDFMHVMDINYLMFVFYATVVTPSIILIFFYVSIYCAARRHRDRLAAIGYALDSRMSVKRQNQNQRHNHHHDEFDQYFENSKRPKKQPEPEPEPEPEPPTAADQEAIESEVAADEMKKMGRVTLSLFLVIVFFHICWYPLHIMNVISFYMGEGTFEKWHFYAPIVLSHVSNAINPFIYGLTMPKYKEAFVEALSCKQPDEGDGKRRRKYQLTERY